MKLHNYLILLIMTGLLFSSCSKETVMTEVFGNIEGLVINGETDQPVPGVSITTTPATNAIFTEENGTFYLENVLTGNYNITARKKNFTNASVSVTVRDDQTAIAHIMLNPVDEQPTASTDDLDAEVMNWFNTSSGDSTFVDVEYRISNIGEDSAIAEYEVYFEIQTDEVSFYVEVSGSNLRSGQNRYGEFTKYIQNFTASDVVVSGKWVSD